MIWKIWKLSETTKEVGEFRCENPEGAWIEDMRQIERDRDLPDEREDWTDAELWTEPE